jgi:hypothetical protein
MEHGNEDFVVREQNKKLVMKKENAERNIKKEQKWKIRIVKIDINV